MRKPAIVLKCHSPDQKHNTQLMTSSAHQGKPWTHRRAQVSWVAPHGGLLGNGAERVTPVAPTEGRFLSRCHSSTHLAPISAPTTIASCTPDMARATPIRAPYPSCVCAASQGTAAGHRVEARPATELRMPLVKPSSCKWSPPHYRQARPRYREGTGDEEYSGGVQEGSGCDCRQSGAREGGPVRSRHCVRRCFIESGSSLADCEMCV
ncbi:hypothetical protein Vafri_17640, partial [Volvox africanus]